MDSQHGHGDNPDSRTRVLTDSGLELYNANIRTHLKKIELVQTEVELCLERLSTTNSEDYETVLEIQKTLNLCHCKYSLYSEEYLKYLRNTRTEDSLRIAEEHKKEDLKYKDIIERALQQTKVSDRHETSSQFTHRSGAHSRASSNSSSVALRKRAKAEAAQVKLEFALKEAEMQKQKAYIEEQEKILKAKSITKKAELAAEIELLNYKKEAAAAVAEAEALQHEQSAFGSKKSDVILAKTAFDRTRQYVEQQGDQVLAADHNVNTLHNPFVNLVVGDACDESRNWPTFKQTPKPSHPEYGVRSVSIVHNDNDNNTKTLNPEALTFQPETAAINQNVATDITRFLMKKDLLLSRLTPYNDKAEIINLGVHHKKNGNITSAIFERTTQDDKPGLSIEDRQFLEIMQANLQKDSNASSETSYPLVQPSDDKELRPILNVHVSKTSVNLQSALGSHHFERFSEWSRLVQSIAFLHRYVRNRKRISTEEKKPNSVELYQEAELFVIRLVQNEVYETEISNMEQNLCLSKNSNIIALNPYLDSRGVLCVGGRLNKSNLEIHEKNPTIIPVFTILLIGMMYYAPIGCHFRCFM
ncbi:unnamed protein product [Mytilus edulis]|uniref:Uncharacterized protein n=1 Tax=Mytilus edulis TaxID=6550 RepID=A0A8S3VKA8_MYTED|nr:unnamed protein product [Mytilus edulis]